MRVRKAVHNLDEEFVRKYERALPAHDPRSWEMQSKLHCSYCAAAYSQFNSSATFDAHHGWLLMPFHRWYVYFHERILATLLGDDTFAIPYWAWDVQNETSPPANIMPSMFTNIGSPLFDPLRCLIHRPPHRVDLKIQVQPHNKEPEQLTRNNHYNMWRIMISETTTSKAFFGGKVSGRRSPESRWAIRDGYPCCCQWMDGRRNHTVREDMAPAYTAARDLLFFAHHSQVDRLWSMWNGLGGRNVDDPDWLDAEFLFYDENADMERVRIRDCLDPGKPRISYEQVPAEWLEYKPRSIRETDIKYARSYYSSLGRVWQQVLGGEMLRNMAMMLGSFFQRGDGETGLLLGRGRAVVTSRVSRPNVSPQRLAAERMSSGNVTLLYDEVLVISGVAIKPFDAMMLFNLFLGLPEAALDCVESLGDVYLEPEGLQIGEETTVAREFTQTIGIGSRFRILNMGTQNSATVTFVPAWDSQYDPRISVRFTELRMELQLVRW